MLANTSAWNDLFVDATALAQRIEGWLNPSEIRFLTLVAAQPTAPGSVVELGAYAGKSTALLALASKQTPTPGIVSVDPIDPLPLKANLEREGLSELVDFRGMYSTDFWHHWRGAIRFLWHDGANDQATVASDVAAALPHLSDGAIVAFHDVRNTSGERLHVFLDQVLGSAHFGAAGVCGTIGWGQYRSDAAATRSCQPAKEALRRTLERLRPYHKLRAPALRGLSKYRYKILRWLVPHGDVAPSQWRQRVSYCA